MLTALNQKYLKISSEEINIRTCFARKRDVNVIANRITKDVSSTISALKNAQLLLTVNPELTTGKALRILLKGAKV
jgi:hypothetical protein